MTPPQQAAAEQRILLKALRLAHKRPCPNAVPVRDDTNCFTTYADKKGGEPYLLLDSVDGEVAKCRKWDGSKYEIETEEEVRSLLDTEIRIIHHYGTTRIEFNGARDFLWDYYTRSVYIRIRIRRALQACLQFAFNQRSLSSQRRVDILRLLVLDRISGNKDGLTYFDILTKLYSERWIKHPSHEDRAAEVEFLLESLRNSGDACREAGMLRYAATNQSLETLERFDEQDRRYRETSRLQLWIVFLTLILALAAIVQAGIIRIPQLWDFAK